LKKTFAENQWFFVPFILTMLFCCILMLAYSKIEIHLFCNRYYSGFADLFFSYITNLGDGIFVPLFVMIMLFISIRYSILLVINFLLSGLVVQLIKHLFIYDALRPSKLFESVCPLHLVSGVHQLYYHSFPSGHSATAFSIFLCFALVTRKPWVKFVFFVCASIIAYSRVYLSQHFLEDIVAGSIIGVIVTLLTCHWAHIVKYPWLDKKFSASKFKFTL